MIKENSSLFAPTSYSNSRFSKTSGYFWDKISRKYSQQQIKDYEAYEFKLEKTQSFFPPNAAVLEFGCGTGMTALNHADKVGHIHAIDSSQKMIAIARENLSQSAAANVEFEVASIEDISAERKLFDVVLGLNVLHLLESPQDVISAVQKLLKPGGVFISSTHCVGDKTPWVRWLVPVGQLFSIMPFVKVFTESDLIRWHSEAGFTPEFDWASEKSPSTIFMVSKVKTDPPASDGRENSGAQNA